MCRSHLGSSSVALSIGSSTHYGTALGRYPIAHGLTHVCSLAVHSSLLVSSLAVHHFGIWQPGCQLSPQLGSTAVNLRRGVCPLGGFTTGTLSTGFRCLQTEGLRCFLVCAACCTQFPATATDQRSVVLSVPLMEVSDGPSALDPSSSSSTSSTS